jgi:predicted deacylase
MEAAGRLGIPAVLTETHPDGFQPEYAVKACSAALLNAMRHLGMLALPGVAPAGAATAQPVIFERAVPGVELKPGTGGYLGVRRWAGERVGRGDVVAEVRSAETFEVVERLVSPLDGAVSCVGDPGGSGFVKAGVTAAVVKPVRRAR